MEDWMLQVGQNKGTERNEMRNFLLNVIEVKRLKRDKEQAALMVYATPGQPFPHPTARFFSVTSEYRYRNRIEILLTSSDIRLKLKSSIDPTSISLLAENLHKTKVC